MTELESLQEEAKLQSLKVAVVRVELAIETLRLEGDSVTGLVCRDLTKRINEYSKTI